MRSLESMGEGLSCDVVLLHRMSDLNGSVRGQRIFNSASLLFDTYNPF